MSSFIYRTTTKKSPHQTAHDIMKILLQAGAIGVAFNSDGKGEITGIDFQIKMRETVVPVRIPIYPDRVAKIFEQEGLRGRYTEQPKKTAWRLAYEWIRSQLSYVTMGQAELAEVFMPYILINGRTTFEIAMAKGLERMLEYDEADDA